MVYPRLGPGSIRECVHCDVSKAGARFNLVVCALWCIQGWGQVQLGSVCTVVYPRLGPGSIRECVHCDVSKAGARFN